MRRERISVMRSWRFATVMGGRGWTVPKVAQGSMSGCARCSNPGCFAFACLNAFPRAL